MAQEASAAQARCRALPTRERKKPTPKDWLLSCSGSPTWARTRDLRINSPTRGAGKSKKGNEIFGVYARDRTYAEREWWGLRLLMLKTHVFQGNAPPNADQMPTMVRFGDVPGAGRRAAVRGRECRGRRRSAPEARIVARGAAVGGGGWGQPWRGGRAAEVANLGEEGLSTGRRGGPLPTPRCPPVFSEAVVCRTPRFADCDAPKRPMVAYPCRPSRDVAA